MLLIPSMVQSGGGNVNVQLQPGMVVFGGQGGRGNEGRVQVDGLNTGASLNGGGVSGYRQDMENAAEVAMSTSGGLGETEVGGPGMNIVPQTGGNTFKEHFFATGLNGCMQSDNFTQRLIDAGLRRPNHINYLYDTSVSSGGPIIKDRLWYFSLVYYRGNGNDISMFHNVNAGDITKWTYVADPNNPAKSDSNGPLQPNTRLTFQVSPRNRLNLFWDEQISSDSIGQGSSTTAPETGGWNHGFQRVQQAKWTSTTTSRLLLEAGVGTYLSNWNTRETPGNDRRFIQVTEQCTAGCATNGGIAGLVYRGQNSWSADWIGAHTWNAAASYITGANNMKFGYQGAYHTDNRAPGGNDLSFRVNNGVPNQLTENINYYRSVSRVRYDALFAQDQWTRGRLTLQGAVRYDHSWSYYPRAVDRRRDVPAGRDDVPGVAGRAGLQRHHAANGRRLRPVRQRENGAEVQHGPVSGGGGQRQRQLLGAAAGVARAESVTRTWTDANGNFAPDCDLQNVNAQDQRTAAATSAARSANWRSAGAIPRSPTIPTSCRAGASGRATGRSAPRCSASSCRASRWRSATRGAGSRTSRSPTIAPRPWPTTRRSASRRRSIRGCPAAAATWSRALRRHPGQVRHHRQLPHVRARTTGTMYSDLQRPGDEA